MPAVTSLLPLLPDGPRPSATDALAGGPAPAPAPAPGGAMPNFADLLEAFAAPAPAPVPAPVPVPASEDAPSLLPLPQAEAAPTGALAGWPGGKILPESGALLPPALPPGDGPAIRIAAPTSVPTPPAAAPRAPLQSPAVAARTPGVEDEALPHAAALPHLALRPEPRDPLGGPLGSASLAPPEPEDAAPAPGDKAAAPEAALAAIPDPATLPQALVPTLPLDPAMPGEGVAANLAPALPPPPATGATGASAAPAALAVVAVPRAAAFARPAAAPGAGVETSGGPARPGLPAPAASPLARGEAPGARAGALAADALPAPAPALAAEPVFASAAGTTALPDAGIAAASANASAATPAAGSPVAASSPAVAPLPERPADARGAIAAPAAPQLESAIAQVGDIREALRNARPAMTLTHAEFGAVSLRLEPAAPDQWRAVLASRDPGFVPAIHAALETRAIAAAAESSASFSGHSGASQNGAGDQRYGSSPNGGQGSPQPYLGQSGHRDGEAAPDHRRPSTAAELAARGASEAEDPAALASGSGGLFA